MSRSYRKPYATEGYGNKNRRVFKRAANKAVRLNDVPNGKAYKKFYCSWNIRDFSFYSPDGDWSCNNPWKYRTK